MYNSLVFNTMNILDIRDITSVALFFEKSGIY